MSQKSKADRKKMATWIGVPFQMLSTIFAGYWLGSWLDEKYAVEKNWWAIGLTLFAVLISLYQLIVQIQRISNSGK